MRETYFEPQKLAHIRGEPNFNSLHGMLLQLKSNTRSVPSTLGGVVHGYVVMVLLPEIYAALAPMSLIHHSHTFG